MNIQADVEQFALDVAVAVLEGRGVEVSRSLTLKRMDGRRPYKLERGDTLRAMTVDGTAAHRFFYVNNEDKNNTILAQQRRIAELLQENENLLLQLRHKG